MPASGG